jgi:hypothetical protein
MVGSESLVHGLPGDNCIEVGYRIVSTGVLATDKQTWLAVRKVFLFAVIAFS